MNGIDAKETVAIPEVTFKQRIDLLRKVLTPQPPPPTTDVRFREYNLVFGDRSDSTVFEGINDAVVDFRKLPDEKKKSNILARSLEEELYSVVSDHKNLLYVTDDDPQVGTALVTHELLKYVAWKMGVAKEGDYKKLQEWTKSVVLDPDNLVHRVLFEDCSRLDGLTPAAIKLKSVIKTAEDRGLSRDEALSETLLTVRNLINIRLVLYKAAVEKKLPGRFVSEEIEDVWARTSDIGEAPLRDYPANALRRVIQDIEGHPLRFMFKTTSPFMLKGSDDAETLRTITVAEEFPIKPTPIGLGGQLEPEELIICNKLFLALQGKNAEGVI